MSTIQHRAARKLLQVIASAAATHKLLTYKTAAKELGRDPKTNSRMVAQVCDLLDAAAALAGVPLLALVMVREISGNINSKAWKVNVKSGVREAIIDRSLQHKFSNVDFQRISDALKQLAGKSNRTAWKYVRETIPDDVLFSHLTRPDIAENLDAINDIGADVPNQLNTSGVRYARDPRIRDAVMRRAAGKCEFCGELGFRCSDGSHYLECHHIIALAKDGADRMTNVIALCPEHHRESHFGKRRIMLEKEMMNILKVVLLEIGRLPA